MSGPSKNKWRWLASLAHVFILFICDGAFLPSADHAGLSSVHASPSSGTAVAVACCLYWEGWEGSSLLCGFRYSASRRAESDDADQTGVVRRHGQERSMIVKDADCHVQIRQMVKGLCFHGVFLVIFFMLCRGVTIHAFIPEDRASTGFQASVSCSRTLQREECGSHVMEVTADTSI